LVLSGTADDDLQTVVGSIRREARGRGPDELPRIGEIVGQAADGDNVGGRAAEKDDGDAAGGSGLRGWGLVGI
jgi:hypothetical protein